MVMIHFKRPPGLHSSVFLANQIWYDPSRATFPIVLRRDLPYLMLKVWQMTKMVFLFLWLITPLHPISRGKLSHLKPLPSMSKVRYSYLSFFLAQAESKLDTLSQVTVSSSKVTLAGLHLLLMIVRSGLEPVRATSGGSVPPLTLHSSRSANIFRFVLFQGNV